ncbi:hypothetical protein [Salibacterium qingdaonense]|uniref:DUF340 domain-containing protein n=1 Tax=Salibacterium qingdaonense TaxID=266892 RepID=A0A1I4MFE7_9BACI|nr:hypothetical protein [Salibacterium qingdaonense]SFM01745.1 hypothetical protein SAMN04488054_11171 [Salibacterium qingdaonense]
MLKNIQEWILLLAIFGLTAYLGNWIGYGMLSVDGLLGIFVLILISLAGLILQKLIPVNIPSVGYIGILGILVSTPWFPGSEYVVEWTSNIQLLALATPILAYAGISIGRNWADFVQLGWRSFVVAACVFLGTFIGSALIAEIILRMQGII